MYMHHAELRDRDFANMQKLGGNEGMSLVCKYISGF